MVVANDSPYAKRRMLRSSIASDADAAEGEVKNVLDVYTKAKDTALDGFKYGDL
jgi:hypothetical protein